MEAIILSGFIVAGLGSLFQREPKTKATARPATQTMSSRDNIMPRPLQQQRR